MKRVARFVMLLVALLLVSPLGAAEAKPAAKPVMKIGVVAPMSGGSAYMGEDIRNGVTMALEEIGATKIDYQFIYEDDRDENRLTNQATLKLIDIDRVSMIYSLWTNRAEIVGQLTEKKGVIQFSSSWDPEAAAKYRWTLVHGSSFADFAAASVRLLKQQGAKRIAMVGTTHLGNKKMIAAARPLIEAAGMQVVFSETLPPDVRDMRTYLLKLKEAGADGLLIPYWVSPQDTIFWKQSEELGLSWPHVTGFFDTYPKEILPYVEGTTFPSDLWTRDNFSGRYEVRFGKPFAARAPHIYDMTRVVITTTEGLYTKLGRVPTNAELLAALSVERTIPDLVTGEGRMHADGWIEQHYSLRKIINGTPTDLKSE